MRDVWEQIRREFGEKPLQSTAYAAVFVLAYVWWFFVLYRLAAALS